MAAASAATATTAAGLGNIMATAALTCMASTGTVSFINNKGNYPSKKVRCEMSSDRETLEKILGGKIEQSNSRNVPGIIVVDGQQVIYFSDDGKNKFRKQFNNITCFSETPNAVRGGVNDRGCKITPPSGPIFYAISYHGDLDGWRKDIETGAIGLGLLLAQIEDDQLVISDGRSIPLPDCKIEFS